MITECFCPECVERRRQAQAREQKINEDSSRYFLTLQTRLQEQVRIKEQERIQEQNRKEQQLITEARRRVEQRRKQKEFDKTRKLLSLTSKDKELF